MSWTLLDPNATERRLFSQTRLREALSLDDAPLVEWHVWRDNLAIAQTIDWGASGWRYLVVAGLDAVDRSAPSFDDEAWAVGTAPATNSAAGACGPRASRAG